MNDPDLFDAGAMQGAEISACETYRFDLWMRITHTPLSRATQCLFILLNPSAADAFKMDPTFTRGFHYAKGWGYDMVRFANVYPYRSTRRKKLREINADIACCGYRNDDAILRAAKEASVIVCGWGRDARYLDRDAHTLELLAGFTLSALRLNKDGTPCHPLYLPGTLTPFIWRAADDRHD